MKRRCGDGPVSYRRDAGRRLCARRLPQWPRTIYGEVPAIAGAANAALATYADADMRIRGLATLRSRVGKVDAPRAVLARTNAGLIGELIKTQLRFPDDRFAVVGGTGELEALVRGAVDLMQDRRTAQRELAEFADWETARMASEDPEHAYLRPLVKLINTYDPTLLLQQLLRAHGNERDETTCRQVFSTVHKAKGREFESVALIDDFPERPPSSKPGTLGNWDTAEGNLLYVAMTRARDLLDVSECPAALDALQRYRR
ncbi:MAG TPA: 3'-5' exonuclease, partial [Rhodanobacteraceae bacterium]